MGRTFSLKTSFAPI